MKRIYLLAMATVITAAGFAQTTTTTSTNSGTRTYNEVSVGIRGAANFTKFRGTTLVQSTLTGGSTSVDTDGETGFSAGLFLNIPITSGFSIEPAVEYARKGAEIENVNNTNYKFTQKLDYLDVPIGFRFGMTKGFSIVAGPQVSFFIDHETSNNAQNGELSTYRVVSDNKNDFRKVVFGGRAGLQYQAHHIGIFANYMTDFTKTMNEGVTPASDRKNHGVQVGLSYIF